MNKWAFIFALILLPSLAAAQTTAPDSTLRVDAAHVVNHITPWMTGTCIEDVNHEIYGGLYAQQIFGESFEESNMTTPLAGWTAYGGLWRVRDQALRVEPDAGAKLVRAAPQISDGQVECEVQFEGRNGGNAGLILRVSNPRTGADTWTGYEISLSALDNNVILGRHSNNWQLLQAAPVSVEPGIWHHLRVELSGPTLRIWVNHAAQPQITYTDNAAPILSGMAGVRTWNVSAAFRNLHIHTPQGDITEGLNVEADAVSLPQVSALWDVVKTSAPTARWAIDHNNPFNTDHAQRLEFVSGTGTMGVANRGLNRWGIAVQAGQRYTGRLYLRQKDYRGRVTIALQSADGTHTYAQQRLAPIGSEWTRRDFTLHSNATDPNARFAIWIDQPGTVWVDQVTLLPTGKALFHGLPFRADIGNKLVDQGITFMRYGGTMVNAPTYRWKQMLGDRDKRPQVRGTWYPNSTNGFGIEEFLQFCEAARIEPAVAINIDETPEDAADMVEYLNGPATSAWGRRRAAAGHPGPYRLRYIEIGNEEAIDGSKAWYARYLERFKILYAAMRARDPDLQFVIAAWWRPDEPLCKQIAQELNGKAGLWDVHVGGDNLRDGGDTDKQMTQMQTLLAQWSPGTPLKACVFEENGDHHDLRRALGHAHMLNVTERHGDFVLMDCPANCLQPWHQNDNGWNQGQVFFMPDRVWGMPPFYAQQMAARNYLPLRVASETDSPADDLDVTATRSEDGSALVLKVVNMGGKHRTQIALSGFAPASDAAIWTLTGNDLDAVNSPEAPEYIHTVKTTFPQASARFKYDFPPYSYTILRFHRRDNK
jgi:alpha-L-arabinofuranosidase